MEDAPHTLSSVDVQAADQALIEKAKKEAKGKFAVDDVDRALSDVYDVQERSLLQFILLGDIAKACKENKRVAVDCIEVALASNLLTKEVKSDFATWKFQEQPWGYEYFYSPELKWDIKIPVRIYVYHNKFKFFNNPNRVWGTTEGFNIPNPFPEYWPLRYLIRAKLRKGMPLSSQAL